MGCEWAAKRKKTYFSLPVSTITFGNLFCCPRKSEDGRIKAAFLLAFCIPSWLIQDPLAAAAFELGVLPPRKH